ncbi:MAG: hypothetical protein Q9228_007115, partial [Teloschistes exilis]
RLVLQYSFSREPVSLLIMFYVVRNGVPVHGTGHELCQALISADEIVRRGDATRYKLVLSAFLLEFSHKAIALDCVTGEPLATIKGFQSTAVSGRDEAFHDPNQRQMCFNIDWKPDLSLLIQEQAIAVPIAPDNTPAAARSLESMSSNKLAFSSLAISLIYCLTRKYASMHRTIKSTWIMRSMSCNETKTESSHTDVRSGRSSQKTKTM